MARFIAHREKASSTPRVINAATTILAYKQSALVVILVRQLTDPESLSTIDISLPTCYPQLTMKYISTNPEIMGGKVVIKDTRIPLEIILHNLSKGYSLKEIQAEWSYVPMTVLRGAIQEAATLLTPAPHAKNLL